MAVKHYKPIRILKDPACSLCEHLGCDPQHQTHFCTGMGKRWGGLKMSNSDNGLFLLQWRWLKVIYWRHLHHLHSQCHQSLLKFQTLDRWILGDLMSLCTFEFLIKFVKKTRTFCTFKSVTALQQNSFYSSPLSNTFHCFVPLFCCSPAEMSALTWP